MIRRNGLSLKGAEIGVIIVEEMSYVTQKVNELPLEIALQSGVAFVIYGYNKVFYQGTDPMKVINMQEQLSKMIPDSFVPKEAVYFFAIKYGPKARQTAGCIEYGPIIWDSAVCVEKTFYSKELQIIIDAMESSDWDKGPTNIQDIARTVDRHWYNNQ